MFFFTRSFFIHGLFATQHTSTIDYTQLRNKKQKYFVTHCRAWRYRTAVHSFYPDKKSDTTSVSVNRSPCFSHPRELPECQPRCHVVTGLGTTGLAPGWLEPDTRSINLLPCPLTEFTRFSPPHLSLNSHSRHDIWTSCNRKIEAEFTTTSSIDSRANNTDTCKLCYCEEEANILYNHDALKNNVKKCVTI